MGQHRLRLGAARQGLGHGHRHQSLGFGRHQRTQLGGLSGNGVELLQEHGLSLSNLCGEGGRRTGSRSRRREQQQEEVQEGGTHVTQADMSHVLAGLKRVRF